MQGYKSELSIFQKPLLDSGVIDEQYVQYRPLGQITRNGVIQFSIINNTSRYIDLAKTTIETQLKIVRKDGSPLGEKDSPGIINNVFHSLWAQVDLYLQQKLVSSSGQNYGFKSYLDVLLNTGADEEAKGDSILFKRDTPATFDNNHDSEVGANAGNVYRKLFFSTNNTVHLIGKPLIDFLKCGKLLLDKVNMDIKMTPCRDEFILMANKPDFKVEIVDVAVKVCFKTVTPGLIMAHEKLLNTTPALYPYKRQDVRIYTMAAGSHSFTVDNIWGDDIPRNVLVTLIGSTAYSGHIQKNPYGFYDKHLSYLALLINNESRPDCPLLMDFDRKDYAAAYYTLNNRKHQIKFSDYAAGYTIYDLTLRAGVDDENFVLKPGKGHTRLELKFKRPLTESTVILLYATFDSCISICKNRTISSHEY